MDLFVPVAGQVKLHVRHRPGVQPLAFLLVHGVTSNARLWDEVADRLASRGHPVYAVDLRGHGDSDTPDEGYDTATAASDVAKVGEALGLSRVVVAGHSWGASVALRLAAENLELVAGLAMVDGGWADLTGDGVVTPRPANAHRTSVVRSLPDESPARWYRSIRVPVMLLPALPPASIWWVEKLRGWVKRAEAALPQATTRWYKNADHHLHVEYPDRIVSDLIDLAGEASRHLVV